MLHNDQKKRIHHLAQKLGLIIRDPATGKTSDKAYREYLQVFYGVTSCLKLDVHAAADCIQRLTHAAAQKGVWEAKPDNRKRYEEYGIRQGFATPAQLRLCEAMWVDVSTQPTLEAKQKAFSTFLLNHFQISHPRFLEDRDVKKVIRTLTAMEEDKDKRLVYANKRESGQAAKRKTA